MQILRQPGIITDRYREVRGHRARKKNGLRPVAQQAAKRVGCRPESLGAPHGEQQGVGVYQTVEGVQRHLVPEECVSKRHDLVNTALWPLVPKERVPMDVGHAVTRVGRCAVIGHYVDKARQGLVAAVKAPSVRASAVANANRMEAMVSDDRDLVHHLAWAHMGIEHAARPELPKHLRVGGPVDIGVITPRDVGHGRLTIGMAAVNGHRGLIGHAGTWVRTLTPPLCSRKANQLLPAVTASPPGNPPVP